MKIFVLTQRDAFYIPRLLDVFISNMPSYCRIVGTAILKGEISGTNLLDYMRLLGMKGIAVNLFEFARYAILDNVSRLLPLKHVYSVSGVCRKHDVPICRPTSINDSTFLQILRDAQVDLVISIACPQLVRKELLQLPPQGVINIHGALLPKYRGKLPSFWVLANGESKTGVSVHYMNDKIDDGAIIVQKEVPINVKDTLHSLVLKSKVYYGAYALVEAVGRLHEGNFTLVENDSARATYYGFPDPESIQRFRRAGRRVR